MWILIAIGACGLALALICAVIAAALRSVHRLRDTNGLSEKQCRRLERYLKDPDSLRITALIGKVASETLFLFCAAWWAFTGGSEIALPRLEEVDRWLFTPLIAVVALALFVELLPPALALNSGKRFLTISLPVLYNLRRLLAPISRSLVFLKNLSLRVVNIQETSDKNRQIAEEILDVVAEAERIENLDPSEKIMIESIVELRHQEVSAIMTPRTDINGIPKESTLADVVDYVNEHGHSRIPVYDESIDKIIGIFYVKDMVQILNGGETALSEIQISHKLRQPFYIPETKRVAQLLEEFQREKLHMAVVLDEYGGTAGIVTIEDVLEEIVGEIADEYDEDEIEERVSMRDDGTAEVDAKVPVEEINEALGLDLPEGEDFETVGGFVFSSMGKVPTIGDVFTHEGTDFEILEADARRIQKLRITPPAGDSSTP